MAEPARDAPPGRNRRIVLYGNPVLRVKAEEVKELDARVRQFLADLTTTMLEQDGLGLAGNQVGEPLAAFAIDPASAGVDSEPYCVINPRVVATEGKVEREEGCLSIPGVYDVVVRPEFVRIAGLDEDGNPLEVEATGLLARAFVHETDHLNATLFIDHLGEVRRGLLAQRLADIEEQEREAQQEE